MTDGEARAGRRGQDGLTDEQRRIVAWEDGPLVVIAGAGTGKTRVIVERVRRLLETKGAPAGAGEGAPGLPAAADPLALPAEAAAADPDDPFAGPLLPEQVLVLTYNVKAAKELADRLEKALGPAVRARLTVANFHSFCHRILVESRRPTPASRRRPTSSTASARCSSCATSAPACRSSTTPAAATRTSGSTASSGSSTGPRTSSSARTTSTPSSRPSGAPSRTVSARTTGRSHASRRLGSFDRGRTETHGAVHDLPQGRARRRCRAIPAPTRTSTTSRRSPTARPAGPSGGPGTPSRAAA